MRPGEFAAILEEGETVLTEDQTRGIGQRLQQGAQGDGGREGFTIINALDVPAMVEALFSVPEGQEAVPERHSGKPVGGQVDHSVGGRNMAVRVQNGADINFGTFGAAATVTHIRIRRASDNGQPVVKALASSVAVAANTPFQIDENNLDILYPSGDLTDAHMKAVVESYWGVGGTLNMEIDAMTDATTVVAVSGYSQQSTSDWGISTETDP